MIQAVSLDRNGRDQMLRWSAMWEPDRFNIGKPFAFNDNFDLH
jgi:hypothetical protein